MATLIQSKQIQGVVTASVISGDFQVSGSSFVTGDLSASRVLGVQYGDITGTPEFVGGSGIVITQVGDIITITNTGGGGGGVVSDVTSIAYLNSYTASNDISISNLNLATASLQSQIDALSGGSSIDTSSFATTGSNTFVGTQFFSGSLIPESSITDDGIHSLGSVSNPWKELYISTASLNFVNDEGVVKTLSLSDLVTFDNHVSLGSISSSAQISALGFISESTQPTDISHLNTFTSSIQSQVDELILSSSTFITSETDSQTLTIVGDQLTISSGNTITIPTGSNVTLPSGLISGSEQVLGGTNILSGSVLTDLSSSIASTIDSIVHTQIPQGTISSSQQISDLGFVTSSGAAGEHTDISSLNQFTSSVQTEIDGLSSLTSSYLTELPSGLVSGSYVESLPSGLVSSSEQVLGGSGILSGSHTDISSLNDFTSSYLTDSASFDTRISNIGDHVNIGNLNTFTQSAESRLSQLESATGSYLTSETDNQTLTIAGDQLTISSGNTITIPTGSNVILPSGLISSSEQVLGGSGILSGSHTDITSLNQFTSSVQTEIDGLSSLTSSYLTELPTDLVSGSVLRTLDGTDVLSGSILPGTGITIDSSSGDYVITSTGGGGDTSFNGNREVTNTLLGDLFTESFNAGTSGSIQDFLNEMFFPSYAPTATFTEQTDNFNTNSATNGTNLVSISVSDTVDDSPYIITLSGTDASSFIPTPINADSSSWELRANGNLTAGSYSYNVIVTDKNSASRTYSSKSLTIAQAVNGTLSTTGTLYIIESATSGQIYLGSNGRSGAQGGVSVSYSPNYGSQSATNFTSSNPLISINSSTGVLSVGSPISGSGNLAGSVITTTIGWNDQYGNTSSDTISVNVTQNNAPDIQFSNSSRLNTNQAINGGGTLVTISFSDVEGDSINHDSFQFTDTSGQLTATRSGNTYLVTANSNLSGSTNYTIGTTIEDVHGFRSNTESHTFNIVQSGNGTITGDTTIYIVESALTGDSFRDATGFGNGNTADVNVTYSPSAGGQSVSSFSSSNPAILINSSGNMTLGVDLSGSVTQSGATIETLITFQDQYGNIGSGSVTANVFGNLAPSVSFVATSDYNTDNALANSNAGVITISDTETNSPYSVTLSGTNSDSFNVVPQNAASSSWQVQPKSSLSLGTYSIDITVTDNYDEVSTLSNKSIVVSSASDYGVVYAYMHNLGSTGNYSDIQYNGIYGIASVNGDTPPEVTSFNSAITLLGTLSNNDVIGDEVITFQNTFNMIRLATISGDTSLDSALTNHGSITFSGNANIFLLYPSGSDMEVPTSIQESINGVSGGGVPYLNADNGGWGIEGAKLHSFTLTTPHLGYSEWFVLGRMGTNGIGSSFEYRIVNANGGSAPS